MSDFYTIESLTKRLEFIFASLETSEVHQASFDKCQCLLRQYVKSQDDILADDMRAILSKYLSPTDASCDWLLSGLGDFYPPELSDEIFNTVTGSGPLYHFAVMLQNIPIVTYEKLKTSDVISQCWSVVKEYITMMEAVSALQKTGDATASVVKSLQSYLSTLYGRVAVRLGILNECREALAVARYRLQETAI